MVMGEAAGKVMLMAAMMLMMAVMQYAGVTIASTCTACDMVWLGPGADVVPNRVLT